MVRAWQPKRIFGHGRTARANRCGAGWPNRWTARSAGTIAGKNFRANHLNQRCRLSIQNTTQAAEQRLNFFCNVNLRPFLAAILGIVVTGYGLVRVHGATASQTTNEIRIVELQGTVEISPAPATSWVLTQTNQVLRPLDRLRTGARSRVALRWSDQSIVSFDASTEIEILPPHARQAQAGLRLLKGVLSFFHRDEPGRIRVLTRGAVAGVEGTEFVLSVDAAERTTLSVIDGRVHFGNGTDSLVLTNGEQAVAELGQPPRRTPGFLANNLLQWCFYYPAVLDLAELPLPPEAQSALGDSLAAYRSGDLLTALSRYPAARPPASEMERVYYAALLLSVGQVGEAETALAPFPPAETTARPAKLAAALRQLIAAVKRAEHPSRAGPELASELLAGSYYEQSRANAETSLKTALELARQAVARSPEFGFGWARVAELEFSFGHTRLALDALNQSLSLAPRNAQALALKGFLLAAQGETRAALAWFDRALAVDAALGNAWLGRGLCRIRRGDTAGGRGDLLMAAAIEPQRAALRSYLGKVEADTADMARAVKELQLAKQLDPKDPTAWLYSALLNQQNNRINDAIRDLEMSQALNDNRSVYRSQLLLDQDRAVRSASLARIYQEAGMSEVGLREAARAVNADYANYAAHLFFADSYQLDLANQTSQRYETASEVEFLLANLLSPVGAGTLSPTLSQSEYSRLFERNRLGLVSSTEYLSRGAWTESGAQYGTFEQFSYDFDWLYASDPGQRANNDFELWRLQLQLKLALTPQDSVYLRVSDFASKSGDLSQQYDPALASVGVRVKETQAPIASLGYHHEWRPGVHTLALASWLDDDLSFTNPAQPTLVVFRPDDPMSPGETMLTGVQGITMHQDSGSRLRLFSGELQQLWQQTRHDLILGGRVQTGDFHTENLQNQPSVPSVFPEEPIPAAQQDFTAPFRRLSFYGYYLWNLADPLQIIGGLTYDRLTFPENFRTAPGSARESSVDEVSPKAGLIWKPSPGTTVRLAYTRSLTGASLDQSYQLEPTQVAGFVQSFRSLIPESVAGANVGARIETFRGSLEQKFDTGTYLGVSAELFNSQVHRIAGAFDAFTDQLDIAIPSGLQEHLDYEERSLAFSAHQLVGAAWSFGARYRVSQAVLKDDFVEVPANLPPDRFDHFQPKQRLEGLLHQLSLTAIYNHRCGFFAEGAALGLAQNNTGYGPDAPDDAFWQFDALAGYRFPRRKAELMIGLLNLTGQDYRLNPLNIYTDRPRERTLMAQLRLNF